MEQGACVVTNVISHALFAYNGVFETGRKGGIRMQQEGKIKKEKYRVYTNLFCLGLVAGICILNIGKSFLLDHTALLDEYTLYQMKYMTVDSDALFWYVFRRRIFGVILLLVASTTYLGLVVCRGAVVWYGFSAGIFLATLIARYGLKGILLAGISVFPQYLLYVPVILTLLVRCEGLFREIYYRSGETVAEDKKTAIMRAGKIFLIIVIMAVGCLLESYVNPSLLLGFLKVF